MPESSSPKPNLGMPLIRRRSAPGLRHVDSCSAGRSVGRLGDAPTLRVRARCGHCRRQLYFRYAISAERTLILENDARGGVAVLRCVGCGEEPNTAAAYRSKSASETLPGCPYSAGGLSLLAGGANLSVQRAGLRAIGGADMHFRRGEVRSGRGQAVLELAVDPSDRLTEIAGAGGEL